jgi:hypothetical protein
MDDSSRTWKMIVSRFGVNAARSLLENLEAEYGPICFRHLALQAIAAGQQKTPPSKRPIIRTTRKPLAHSKVNGSRHPDAQK